MSTKLWGGCFSKDIDSEVLAYTLTTDIDKRLVRYDIWGSIAHLLMLSKQKIVSEKAAQAMLPVLLEFYQQNEAGQLQLDPALEDVHLNIESMLISRVGPEIGGQLHTARSRNDQVVTDTRMYLRAELLQLREALSGFADWLLAAAQDGREQLALGYTHLQPAQPISLGFWYSSYASMLLRDLERLQSAFQITNRNTLGACALAGTSFPLDRDLTARLLGFERLQEHSLDATSSRDFVMQSLSAFAILMSNFSRLAEEIVVWGSHEFGLLDIDDAFATGSSIMPQKKNPVVAELVKGRVGRVYGALMQMLTTGKGLTLGYHCDLQEDKPMLWDALDTVKSSTNILHRHLATTRYRSERAHDLCWQNFSTVTELANMLVKQKQIPFREAHRITGNLTRACMEQKTDLRNSQFVLSFLHENGIQSSAEEIYASTAPENVMRRQISKGATGPDSVQQMVERLRTELEAEKANCAASALQLQSANDKILRIASMVADRHALGDILPTL